MHQQLIMFKQCVVTACSYGPFLDANDCKDEYEALDTSLAKTLMRILQTDQPVAKII